MPEAALASRFGHAPSKLGMQAVFAQYWLSLISNSQSRDRGQAHQLGLAAIRGYSPKHHLDSIVAAVGHGARLSFAK